MLLTCVWCPTKPNDQVFLDAFVQGIRANGDQVWVNLKPMDHINPLSDAVVVFGGYKPIYKPVRAYCYHANKPMVYLDRGYLRQKVSFNPAYTRGRAPKQEHMRVVVGATQPTELVGRWNKPGDRRERFGWKPVPWNRKGENIVLVWSGGAYHEGAGIASPDDTAADTIAKLKQITKRPILYRPKPKRPFKPIEGVITSEPGVLLEQDLENAFVMVTIGGSSCANALLCGIPSIILGDGVTKWLSSTRLEDVDNPRLASLAEVTQFLNDLAYCQWTLEECADGTAWSLFRTRIK